MESNRASKYKKIDSALHQGLKSVKIDGETLKIKESRNGQRYTTWAGLTFITQDPLKPGKYAKIAASGKSVTRILRPGTSWGAMVSGNIKDG